MESIKILNSRINLFAANGVTELLHNNDWIDHTEYEIKEIFDAEEFYMANRMTGIDCEWKSFNTYNWNAPIVIDGAFSEGMEYALINIQLGGDVRGNYSKPYFVEGYDNVSALLSQYTELEIELSDGRIFRMDCENGEAFFDFDSFDPMYIDFDKDLTEEQIEEMEEKMEEI